MFLMIMMSEVLPAVSCMVSVVAIKASSSTDSTSASGNSMAFEGTDSSLVTKV
ncbi:MAG: hypothetical protein LPK09_13710 [Hymenobacteraceae bacterium]|nr:hypothetical protein [Hymenobacteraceae bacterium]